MFEGSQRTWYWCAYFSSLAVILNSHAAREGIDLEGQIMHDRMAGWVLSIAGPKIKSWKVMEGCLMEIRSKSWNWEPPDQALRARNPKRVRNESERVSRASGHEGAPESPKSASRVRKESKKRSFGLFLTPERTLWGLWGSPDPDAWTPFWTLFGLFWGSEPEGRRRPRCLAGGFPIKSSSPKRNFPWSGVHARPSGRIYQWVRLG